MADKITSKKQGKKADKDQIEKANKLNKDNEEFCGQDGPDPTRYGDWEKGGRCSDF